MKRKICLILLACCLLLTACEPTGDSDAVSEPVPEASPASEETPAVELSEREQNWLEDIEFLREACKTKHMDPFYLCSEEKFDWKLDQLAAKVGELSDDDIALEIVSIVAGLGDPHSYALAGQLYDTCFPIHVSYFDNKLYLTAYLEGFEQFEPYLLHEIVAVNGVDMAYLTEKANRLGNPYNTWLSKEYFTERLFSPSFFDWAGCDYKEGYIFQILDDNQEVESVDVPVISHETASDLKQFRPEIWSELIYMNNRNSAAYFGEEDNGCVYMSLVNLSSGSDIQRLIWEAEELLEEHSNCDKLVIDLRRCPGGNAKYVELFPSNAHLLEVEHTYVLTGGTTASAAMTFISYFKGEMGAVTVGEPTGQFPSMFHMQTSLDEPCVLPHSQIAVMLSNTL